MALMRDQNRQGSTHCDGLRPGIKLGGSVENGGLLEYFFGNDGEMHLHHDKFVWFLRKLHDEVSSFSMFLCITILFNYFFSEL